MREISFDIMVNEMFYHTLKYRFFGMKPTEKELREFAISKLPTLKYKEFEIYLNR